MIFTPLVAGPEFRHQLSDVVVEGEFVRVGPQSNGVHLALTLVPNPGIDDVFGKNVLLEQKIVIPFERIERGLQ